MFGQGTRPLDWSQWFVQSAFSMANFFKSILCVKTAELKANYWIVIEKWYNRWIRLLTMLLPGRIYIEPGPWHFGDFCKIFLSSIGEDQKKFLRFERRALSWYCDILWSIRPWLMHYVHKKATWGSEIATFRTKTIHFFQVIRLNWLAKIELRGTQGPWSSILLLVTVANKKC